MIINTVYQLVLYIANKEQRGDISPAKFNILAKTAQLQFISKRVGNIQIMTDRGVPQVGYESTWRIHEDLRPFVYGPVQIPVNNQGNFNYPYGYIWPDAIHKNDFRSITRLTSDQYPFIKNSQIKPPTQDHPVCVLRNPYGFIDPYSIGSFQMSYLKMPPDPVWGYIVVNDSPVFDQSSSVDFTINPLSYIELVMIILQNVGVNLSSDTISQYAMIKEQSSI